MDGEKEGMLVGREVGVLDVTIVGLLEGDFEGRADGV